MKSIKRMMAIVIAMVIALALGTATFADNTTTQVQTTTAKGAGSFDITMKGAEDGHKFSAYRIFDGAVDTEGKLSEISWATGVNTSGIASDLATAGLPDTAGGKTLDLSNAEDVATALATLTDDTETVQKVADVFYSRIGSAAGTADSKTGSNYVISNLVAGYYLVTDEYKTAPAEGAATLSRNILAVVGDVEAQVKNDKPTVVKKILDPTPVDANKAGIGDHVFYQISSAVPNYTGYDNYFFVINDTLSSGLTFDGAQNLVVKVGDATLVKDTDYVVYTGDDADGYTFRVAFKNIKAYTIADAITVNYSATVNQNAVIGNTGNLNETDVTYSNNPNDSSDGNPSENPKPDDDFPVGTSVKDKTITYVAELDLTKYFDEVKAGNELAGAQFTLTGTSTTVIAKGADNYVVDENGSYYKLTDGTYTTTAPHGDITRSDGSVAVTSNESSYEDTTTKYSLQHTTEYETIEKEVFMQGTSSSNGKINFKGLGAGTYTLKETVTPTGYNTAEDITFTIVITPPTTVSTGNETATYAVSGVNPANAVTLKDGSASAGIYEADVIDKSGAVLPSTGGIGTTIFYIIGAILVLGAGILLVTRRRMSVK